MHEDRLEADLRAALHREMAMARVGESAPRIRARIAARERSRRWTRAALGIAAVLAIALSVPVVAPVAQRALAPDQPTDTAVTVRLETGGDLVVEKVSFDGSAVVVARLPRAADWLRPTVDPARLQPGTKGTVMAFHPDGYLAVAVAAAEQIGSPVAVLVWNLTRPADEPARVDTTTASGGSPVIGWTADARLVVAADIIRSRFDVLEARTGRVVDVTLPEDTSAILHWFGGSTAGAGITSTPDGQVVVITPIPAMFSSGIATAGLPRDGGAATLTEGLPAAVWSVTGLDAPWGVRAGYVGALGSSNGLSTAGVQVLGLGRNSVVDDPQDAQTWAILGPGEQLVGQPAWDAQATGAWFLQGTGRRLDLVHLDGPGLASTRAALPWDGTTGSDRNAIAGVARDGRGLIVRQAGADLFVDGATGRWVKLAAGARFVGWADATTTATPEERPICSPVDNADLAGTRISGPAQPFVEGLPAGMGGAAFASPRPAADALGLPAAQTFAGAGLRLLLPDGACAFGVTAEAVPVDDPGAKPLRIDSPAVAPGGPGGLRGLAEPPPGRWIVRAWIRVAGGTGSSVASLLFRVDVAAGAPSPSPGESPGAPLVLDGPPTGSLPGSVVLFWTVQHGGADAPADGVSTFGDPASPPLRAGPVEASVACTGDGSILVAATTGGTAPPAERWTRVTCSGLPRDVEPASIDLPDAAGGETVLRIERRPTRADDLLGYSVVVGQPIDVACDTPTAELAMGIGLRASPDATPRPGMLVAYEMPAGSRGIAASDLAAAASLPVVVIPQGVNIGGPSLALPAGLCATGWTMEQAEVGATLFPSGGPSFTGDNPAVGEVGLATGDPGDWVISVTVSLPGSGDVTASATFLWHVRVSEDATLAP